MQGQFVWYDLITTDPEGAKKFYRAIGGWSTQPFPQSDPNNLYTMFTEGGTAIGGVMSLPKEQRAQGRPSSWTPSIEVNNVDSSTRQAESLGGKVVMPAADVPETGRYAVLQDPQGAIFAIFTPLRGPMATAFDGTPRVGRMSWHELMTTDWKKAFDFYRQLFGWEKTSEMDMGGGDMYLMYGKGGKMYGGIFNRQPSMGKVPPFWLNYIFVSDLKKSIADATKAGAKVVNGPMDIPGGGSIVVLADPQGAAIALHSNKPLEAKAAKPKAKVKAKAKAKAKVKVKAKPTKRAKAKPRSKAKKKAGRR